MDGAQLDRALRRNVVVNGVGLVAKVAQVSVLLVLTRLFGADVAGVFLLGYGLYEIGAGLIATGFTEATVVFASHHADDERGDPDALRRVLATSYLFGGGCALLLAIAVTVLAPGLAGAFGPQFDALAPGLPYLAWAIVPAALARISLSAMNAFLRLEWDVLLNSAGVPIGLLAALVTVRAAGGGATEIFASVLVVQLVVAAAALTVLTRHLRRKRRAKRSVLGALLAGDVDRRLLRFAWPQGLSVAATYYIARIDVVLLAYFGAPAALVGWYGTAGAMALELRQARLIISGALAPIVARHHAAGERGQIARLLATSAAWIGAVIVPVVLAAVVLRDDLLALFSPVYRGDSRFIVVLLLAPLVNCLGGLAGNFLVFTLHSRWMLLNAAAIAVLHTLLDLVLIPRFGVLGAAAATATSITLVTVLENAELHLLERVHIRRAGLVAALAALAVGAGILAATWDPTALPFVARLALAGGVALLAALVARATNRRLAV